MAKDWVWVESKNGTDVILWASGVQYFETTDAVQLARKMQEMIREGYELVFRVE